MWNNLWRESEHPSEPVGKREDEGVAKTSIARTVVQKLEMRVNYLQEKLP